LYCVLRAKALPNLWTKINLTIYKDPVCTAQ